MEGYVEPSVNAAAFHCPHCQSYSDQYWIPLRVGISHGNVTNMPHYTVGFCNHCRDTTIWKDTFMIYPSTGGAPPPNPDMSELIKKDYNEARDVATRSPRSACMLLRLCVQKICDERVPGRYDLNAKIGKLVEQGLDDDIRKACDSVRVISSWKCTTRQIPGSENTARKVLTPL